MLVYVIGTAYLFLGLDPWRFSYPYQGLQQRLIGPEGHATVRKEILA